MLPWVFVRVTPRGPVPKVAHAIAGTTPVASYGNAFQGHRLLFAGGTFRNRIASPTGERSGCIFRKPGRFAYRLEGSSFTGVVIVRAA
jgi:hypothetical protein